MKGKERGEGKMKMVGLKSKRGARKRKEIVERMERERFGKNLAVIMAAGVNGEKTIPEVNMAVDAQGGIESAEKTAAAAPASNPAVNRFAALRAWVNANMEKHPAFEEKK